MLDENYNTPGWMTVGFVVLLVSYDYYVFMFKFVYNWVQIQPFLCLLVVIPFQGLMVLLAVSYKKAIFTEPGYINQSVNDSFSESDLERLKQYAVNEQKIKKDLRKKNNKNKKKLQQPVKQELTSQLSENINSQTQKQDNEITRSPQKCIDNGENLTMDNFDILESMSRTSFCLKCNQVKPPRAHHCKECKRCILRMDHHCPWVANCVGQQNHKYFILFLLYASLTGFIPFLCIVVDYLQGESVKSMLTKRNDQLQITICGSTCFALFLCIGFLFTFQVRGMLKNITTVEYHVEEMHTKNPFKRHDNISNIMDIFGSNKKYWLLPVDTEQQDNFSYGRFENELKA